MADPSEIRDDNPPASEQVETARNLSDLDQEQLREIALGDDDTDNRLAAVSRITDPHILCRIAEQNCGKAVGLAVVVRIEQEDLLQRLCRKGSNKAVRRLAEERLQAIPDPDAEVHIPEAKRASELERFCREAEAVADSWQWDETEAVFSDLDLSWGKLDPHREQPQRQRFETARKCFYDRFHIHQRELEREKRKRDEQAKNEARREFLCVQVEEVIGRSDDMAVQQADDARIAWDLCVPLPDERIGNWQKRFVRAQERFHARREKQIAAQEDQSKRLQRLHKFSDEAEALAASDKSKVSEKRLHQLRKQWSAAAAGFDMSTAEVVKQRFDHALASLQKVASENSALEMERAAEKERRLEELCARVERLGGEQARSEPDHVIQKAHGEFDKILKEVSGATQKQFSRRFQKAWERARARQRELREDRTTEQWANLTAKEALCMEVEALSSANDLYKVAKAVKDAQAQWKKLGPVPRDRSDAIWQRFKSVCDNEYGRCREFFSRLDDSRKEALKAKKDLARELGGLLENRSGWQAANRRYYDLVKEWHAIGQVPREQAASVRRQFQEACRRYAGKRATLVEHLCRDRQRNIRRLEKLCESAAALADSCDWEPTAVAVQHLEAEWEAVGPLRAADCAAYKEKFGAACDTFRKRRAEFYEELERQRPTNLDEKQVVAREIETLAAGSHAPEQIREVVGQVLDLCCRWSEVGPVHDDKAVAARQQFDAAVSAFFSRDADNQERNQLLKEELLAQMKVLGKTAETRESARRARHVIRCWDLVGTAPEPRESKFQTQFKLAEKENIRDWKKQFAPLRKKRLAQRREKEELCTQLELLADVPLSGSDASTSAATVSLADQLRLAFESNFVVKSSGDERRNQRVAQDEVKKIRTRWDAMAALPPTIERALHDRFVFALEQFRKQNR